MLVLATRLTIDVYVSLLELATVASVGTLSSLFVNSLEEFHVAAPSRSLFVPLKGGEDLLRLDLMRTSKE